jgi:hypothetical protein
MMPNRTNVRNGSFADYIQGGQFLPLSVHKADIAARRSFRAAACGLVKQVVLGIAENPKFLKFSNFEGGEGRGSNKLDWSPENAGPGT